MVPYVMEVGILRMSCDGTHLKFLPKRIAEMKFKDEPRELVEFTDQDKIGWVMDTLEATPPQARPWENEAGEIPFSLVRGVSDAGDK